MGFRIRTHISSSAGNCVQVDCEGATLLLDCGFQTQRDCNAVLNAIRGDVAVFVSHAHRDHISYSAAKAMSRRGVGIHMHCDCLGATSHSWEWEALGLKITPFGSLPFGFGPFAIRAVDVPHAPGFPNVACVMECGTGLGRRKLVFCTDTYDAGAIAHELIDADFIYLESNHDLELLRRFPNPASRYHLSNPNAAKTLCDALRRRPASPQIILLGHLSEQRNLPMLAINTVRACFAEAGVRLACPLLAAPARHASDLLIVD